jgi:hypothetical protein
MNSTLPIYSRQRDPIEQIESEDRSSLALLKLVVCAAIATLALALAGALQL